jgi:hypothetical protein
MAERIILDNEYVTLKYHSDTAIVHHKFHKFVCGQDFRNALNKGTETLQQFGARKWLSDNRDRGALPAADVEWTQNDWFPRTVRVGWKYWALVMPEKVAGQISMQRAVDYYSSHGITVQVFTDPDAAMRWLIRAN